MVDSRSAISLFCSGGIGDLALHAAGFRTVAANELLEERARLYQRNVPGADVVIGDIQTAKDEILKRARAALGGGTPDLLFATPPCQGMSKNGRGKLLQGVRAGRKPVLDPRNRLMLPALEIAAELLPWFVVTENVPEMEHTLIETGDGEYETLPEVMRRTLAPLGYAGSARVVEFADYGVPQRRRRLITVFCRDPGLRDAVANGDWLPPPTHAKSPGLLERAWISVDQAIAGLPPLDARDRAAATSDLPLHRVPTLDRDKYFWVANTPAGASAFDNQCAEPSCGHDGNPTHSAGRNADGVNRASRTTPVHCQKCGALLPRPWVEDAGGHRIMSGFTSAYKRMRGDLPASALTRNLSYACSDQKLHPDQNRVLSLHEACILHTISDYAYVWERSDGKRVSDKLIREVIGESIPPAGLQPVFDAIADMLAGKGARKAA